MRKLKIGIIDIVANSPSTALYARAMRVHLAGVMPQVIAVWCEQLGHDVHLAYRSGSQNLIEDLPDELDIVFMGAFTTSAQAAYALSNYYRTKGAVTVLGGPHARAYPEDAARYFDYVLGFTDKNVIQDVLQDCEFHRPLGIYHSVSRHPSHLPGIRERWKYIKRLMRKAPLIKSVSLIGSLGCPHKCDFCVDAVVPYQPLDFDVLKEDLRFLLKEMRRPIVAWHDPNFGVRFNDYMDAIEEAVPQNRIKFVAENNLSLLSEKNVIRLRKNGFKAVMPGIESWYDMGTKSGTGTKKGPEKVAQVAEQINMILRYLPYVQVNFVNGLDCDAGPEPFELTKQFLDKAPGAFPAFSMLTAFGRSAPLNLTCQREGRLIPFPFHVLNNNGAMNVKPRHYSWPEFYDNLIDLHQHAFSLKSLRTRFSGTRGAIPKAMNILRGISSEGWGKTRYFREVRRRLDEDTPLRDFFEQETRIIPQFFIERIQRGLGPLMAWLPQGAIDHDPEAYLKSPEVPGITHLGNRNQFCGPE